MIEILLNDKAYEQDIRELLMAFYPGETFSYEPVSGSDFSVEGMVDSARTHFNLKIISHKRVDFPALPADLGEEIESEMEQADEPVEVHYENRTETKSRIKKRLYALLVLRTGRLLPWGTLTGIRPVKIVMTKLEEGMTEEEIAAYMKETYYTSRAKIALAVKTAVHEKELLKQLDYENGYSLYIGIPFCPTTCLYCSFTSFPISQWKGRTGLYLEALYHEMRSVAQSMKGKNLDSVYFGGGTPTSLEARELDWLLEKLESTFDLSGIKELTVEAGRPDSITREKLSVLKKHGVTRISVNPQTMNQGTLDLIGRRHTVDMVKECFAMAREEGFDNINMDLIVGLPEERLEDVRNTMEEIRRLGPDSVTVHSLAIKRAARLNTMKEVYKDLRITGTQEMIDMTARYAADMGMEPYYLYRQKNMAGNFENVGYAKPGKACLYNILIMEEQQTIAACGAGSTTKVLYRGENRIERAENVKDVEQYISRIDEMIERKRKLL